MFLELGYSKQDFYLRKISMIKKILILCTLLPGLFITSAHAGIKEFQLKMV